MNRWFHRLRRRQFWVTLVALPALAFRLAIPAGFMPGIGTDHSITMELCHGVTPASTTVHYADDGRPLPAGSSQHDSPCAFAASAVSAPPPVVLPVASPGDGDRYAATRLPATPELAPAFRAQSPRGPPSLG